MQEIRVLSLDWEDPLEKGKATHSSILALRIPWTEEPGRLWSIQSQESDATEATYFHSTCSNQNLTKTYSCFCSNPATQFIVSE